MARGYDHQEIEKRAQEKWAQLDLYTTDLTNTEKDPYYLLFEFPYPSGDLHIGHWYAFAVTDIYARYLRMKGKNVLFPIGFDSFGLPAENAAMKNGADPKEWTYANMDRMRAQIKSMGTSVDWSKEIVTSDPEYYKWTQWLFAKLFEHNLAERREAPVKWCPKDQTVLANEQVVDGKCERCGTEVVEKRLTQWFMRITEYAERLLADLDALPWREDIKEAQRAWIGKKEGINIDYEVEGTGERIQCFTTRPDTNFGATFVVLAPEHPFVKLVATGALPSEHADEVAEYIGVASKKTERERQAEEKEKTGVFTGYCAINNLNGAKLPVWVSDFVLGGFGTGAVVGVPGHDLRDYDFAIAMGIPVVRVVVGPDMDSSPITRRSQVQEATGTMTNSEFLDGLDIHEATKRVMDHLEENGWGKRVVNYRIRDWLVSRQRYWGCPIPVVYDPEGTPHLVPSDHLPWLLPTDVDFTPTGNASGSPTGGKAPLASSKELHDRVTKIFGEGWTPEYDTLDTFVDSSWYFLRYLDPKDDHDFSDAAMMKKWLPVNRYSGGSEHTTMHLLYARFFHKALYDLALVPTPEPFNERFNRGIILGTDGQKMSKRWGNVVNPDEVVKEFGTDAVRLYLAFIGPYNEAGHYPWSLDGVSAMRRFLERVITLSEKLSNVGGRISHMDVPEEVSRMLAKAEAKSASDSERFKFNTALSALMVLVRDLEGLSEIPRAAYRDLVVMLAPFAPHLAEELWAKAGGEASVHQAMRPAYDAALLESDTVPLVVQVAGKRRGEVTLAPDASEDEAVEAALHIPAVTAALGGKNPSRRVYVPGKILNLVP